MVLGNMAEDLSQTAKLNGSIPTTGHYSGDSKMLMADRIINWVHSNINSQSYTKHQDLHVDAISATYKARQSWITAFEEISKILRDRRADIPLGFCVPISVSLTSEHDYLGVKAQNIEELEAEFSVSPPSLYVFRETESPWHLYPDSARLLPSAFLPWNSDDTIKSIHFEYREPHELMHRRSLWVVT